MSDHNGWFTNRGVHVVGRVDLNSTDALEKLARLECPDCGDKLLRGPRGGASQNVTCRACMQKFVVHGVVIGVVVGAERIGTDERQAAYYDPAWPARRCDNCNEEYTGPAVFCCLCCALDAA